jgi:hypothetical protein
MIELAAIFATLCLFLAWRLFAAHRKMFIMEQMIISLIRGDMNVTKTEAGVIIKMERSTDE